MRQRQGAAGGGVACHHGVTREGLAHRARPERMRTRAHTPRNGRKPRSVKTEFSQRPTPPGRSPPCPHVSPLGASLRHTRTPGPLHRPCPLPGMCLPECPSLYANVTFSGRLI